MSFYLISEFIFGRCWYTSSPQIDLFFSSPPPPPPTSLFVLIRKDVRREEVRIEEAKPACLCFHSSIPTREESLLLRRQPGEREVPARRTGRLIDCSHGVFLPTRRPRSTRITPPRQKILRSAPASKPVGSTWGGTWDRERESRFGLVASGKVVKGW